MGPFLVILSHFGPFGAFFDPFWPFGCGAKAPSGSGPPYSWGKMGWGVKIGESRWPKWRPEPVLGPLFGHFEPFLGPFGYTGLEALGMGARSPICREGEALGERSGRRQRAEALAAQP